MSENELGIGQPDEDSLTVLEGERLGKEYISKIRQYRIVADKRLAEMRAQGLIGVGRHALPEEEIQSLMQQFGLNQSLVHDKPQEDES